MKKLLYIFLTVLIFACSGEDSNNNSNNGSNVSIEGKWNFISITDCGNPVEQDDCDLESYMLLENGDGMYFNFDTELPDGDSGPVPCQVVGTANITYFAVPNTNTYNFIVDGVVDIGTISGNTLTFIQETAASNTTCPQQEGTITEILVFIKD